MFTHKCYIRKINKEIFEKLEMLGYEIVQSPITTSEVKKITLCDNGVCYEWGFYPENAIDCGENENLFLAIAALRNDSDINQWFVYNNTDWENEDLKEITFFLCKEKNVKSEMCCNLLYNDCRKATVEELIKHFTKE